MTTDEAATIPVVEEDLRVGKREVGGGRVRVRSYVTERPVEEQVELRQERVDGRAPAGRPRAGARRSRVPGDGRSRRSSAARRR